MRRVWSIVLICLSLGSTAQEKDSTYYKSFPRKLSVGSFIAVRNYALLITPQVDGSPVDSLRSNYQPNDRRVVGISLNLDKIGANLSVSIPDNFKSQQLYGTTRRIEANLGLFRRRGIITGQFIGTQGFADKNSVNYLDRVLDEDNFYVREDLSVWNVQAGYLHIWNWTKFSARAAAAFSERQLKSAGSVISSIQLRHFRVGGDSIIIPYATRPYYETLRGLQQVRFNETSLGLGYAYTFVPADCWFIHGTAILKGTLQHQRYREAGRELEQRFVVNPAVDLRLSTGYAQDFFWITFKIGGYADLYNLPGVNMNWGYFNASLHFGIRIPTPRSVNKVYRSAIPE